MISKADMVIELLGEPVIQILSDKGIVNQIGISA